MNPKSRNRQKQNALPKSIRCDASTEGENIYSHLPHKQGRHQPSERPALGGGGHDFASTFRIDHQVAWLAWGRNHWVLILLHG